MIPRPVIFSCAALFAATAWHCGQESPTLAPPWAHEGSDLRPDEGITFGKLPNGLRYAIMPNPEPKKRVSARLVVETGSLMEEDTQQGLAHFLEHMAFNGTKHFKANEMKAYFERLGMSFGADTNAHTSFKETVYKLELTDGTDDYIADALKLFRDYADGMLLLPEEIDKERGVIIQEKRARDSVHYRMMVEGFKFGMPESLVPKRLPIGLEEIILNAPRERFTSFYSKWYTPDRLTLVFVGNVDAAKLIPKIKESFGSLKPPAKRVPDPDLGKVDSGYGVQARFLAEKEAGEMTIQIEVQQPLTPKPDNAANRHYKLIQGLASMMVNRRLEILAKQENPPFTKASIHTGDEFLDFVRTSGVSVESKPELWERALETALVELRRALQHGFTESEFKEAKANVLEDLKTAAQQAATRQSRALADMIAGSIGDRQVVSHPADDLKRVEAGMEKIKVKDCHDALCLSWDTPDVRIFMGGNLDATGVEDKMKAIFAKAMKAETTPPVESKDEPFAYTDFGPPGTVAKTEEVKDLGITLVTFENGVRLNLKPTDFTKDEIAVTVRFGAGRLTAPEGKPGLNIFTMATFDAGGLEKHSADDIERILAGKSVGAGLTVEDEYFNLSGKTNKSDVTLQFQLMAAYFTAPGYREDGMRQLMSGVEAFYQQVEHTPEGFLQSKYEGHIRPGDHRFAFPTLEQVKTLKMEDVKAWLAPALQQSAIEIGVVGDFDPAQIIAATAATFGALPKRMERPAYEEERKVKRAEPGESKITFTSKLPKGIVAAQWPTTDRRSNITLARQCNVLAAVLDDLINNKVREELGDSYSPDVHATMSDTFKDDGAVLAYIITDGAKADKIAAVVKETAAGLAKSGITEDQLTRAKAPLLKMMEDQKRQNRWWLQTVVGVAQSQPERLNWARTLSDDYAKVSVADVNKLAAKYLTADRAIVTKIVPEVPKTTGASAEKGTEREGDTKQPTEDAPKPKADPDKAQK